MGSAMEPGPPPVSGTPPAARLPDPDALDALLTGERARWGVPGAVVGVLAGGRTLVRAAGVTSLADPAPVTGDTPFRVASITKPLAATVAALLAQQRLLDLDAPVAAAVPGLRLASAAAQAAVTPRLLLAHLSGLECEPPHSVVEAAADDGALARLAARFGEVGQLTPPGDVWSYCNAGYWLAGHACAVAAGAPFEQAAADLLLRPLGMAASGFVHDGVPPAGAALGHAPRTPGDPAHDVVPGYRFPRSRVPSGGLVSTVPDLLRFAALHLDAASPHAAALAALREPLAEAPGYRWGTGWGVETWHRPAGDGGAGPGALAVAGHSGSYGGFQCRLVIVPERGLAAVVLTNSGRGSALVRSVLDHLLEECAGVRRHDPAPLATPPDPAAFEGVYRAQNLDVEIRRHPDGRRLVGAQRGTLATGEVVSPPPLEGVAVGPSSYAVTAGEARGARFDFPGSGRVRLGMRLALRAG